MWQETAIDIEIGTMSITFMHIIMIIMTIIIIISHVTKETYTREL